MMKTKYDLQVYGGTPGGVAAAVRAAREGLRVLLIHPHRYLGGGLANGVSVWDTFYDGSRSPLFDEIKLAIQCHYRDRFGAESPEYLAALPGPRLKDHATGAFEPSVARLIFETLAAGESNLTVWSERELDEVQRTGRQLKRARFGEEWVDADYFIDASYEGDLLALAGAAYRVGREGRHEFAEPHAGRLFALKKWARVGDENTSPRDAYEGRLNLRTWMMPTVKLLDASTGEADGAVQAYNYRLALSCRPENRRLLDEPPGYDRTQYAHLSKFMRVHPIGLINDTCGWNGGRPIGWNFEYPEADWPQRRAIMQRYRDFAVGALYFLQNDVSMDPAAREFNQRWGLALDQFTDNDHLPYEGYIREARRLVGRYVLRESDGLIAAGTGRAPIHHDSIGFTEWPMDSVQCLPESVRLDDGSEAIEGAFFLSEESRPGMIPWRSLQPVEVDNLLVPVCLSATHVFWGAARLEPVWIQTGEAAGLAAVGAIRNGGHGEQEDFLVDWVRRGAVVSFFNDDPGQPAAQYFATKGFFHDYNARWNEPLKEATLAAWQEGLRQLRARTLDPNALARKVAAAEETSRLTDRFRGEVLEELFAEICPSSDEAGFKSSLVIRGEKRGFAPTQMVSDQLHAPGGGSLA